MEVKPRIAIYDRFEAFAPGISLQNVTLSLFISLRHVFASWTKQAPKSQTLGRTQCSNPVLCSWFFRCKNAVVIALPSHSSHSLQPLDFGIWSVPSAQFCFQSYLEAELHMSARTKNVFIAFDIAHVITTADCKRLAMPNIISRFKNR